MTSPVDQATAAPLEGLASTPAAVSASSVSKAFRLPHEQYSTVKEQVLHPFTHRGYEVLRALDDVSFDVRRGEAFGIVGRNGSGKSTLLKCVSGIYRLDSGAITVEGRLAPFIELGVGFNPELTARDNVIANAVLLGLSRAQARQRFEDIVGFAELEQFVDLKLKNYSSGMTMRLAFAVTIQVDADVLLLDEVLAVGDASFREKCFGHFARLKREGRTMLLVTHSMEAVEGFCDRARLLDRGRVVDIGEPARIAEGYEEINARARDSEPEPGDREWRSRRRTRPRSPRARGSRARLLAPGLPRLLALTRTLAVAQFKVKYLDAGLSYLWVIVGPLAYFAILYFVFTAIGRFHEGVADYGLYLLCSLVLWMYFADATSGSLYCLARSERLLRRIPFPHVVLPLSVIATALFDLCMSSVAVLAFILGSGITPRLSWLEVPPLVLVLSVFVTGLGMLLSALYVRYRDVDHIWALLRQFLFFASPIFYVVASVPESIRPILLVNPLAAVFTEVRHAVLDPTAPSVVEAYGGVAGVLIPALIVCGTFALGLWVFRRESPTAAENL